ESGKDNIGLAREALRVKPISETRPVQEPTNSQLRRRVDTSNPPHVLASTNARELIHPISLPKSLISFSGYLEFEFLVSDPRGYKYPPAQTIASSETNAVRWKFA